MCCIFVVGAAAETAAIVVVYDHRNNDVELITGQTPSQDLKDQTDNIVKSVPEIKRVYNQLTIQGPTSSLTRTSDS